MVADTSWSGEPDFCSTTRVHGHLIFACHACPPLIAIATGFNGSNHEEHEGHEDPKVAFDELSRRVIGSAIELHRHRGPELRVGIKRFVP
jgi:hypothetical protein